MSGTHLSKEFFELIKSIGESRSKQEEDQIIVREVQTLKKAMAAQGVTSKQMKEFIIRMIYVEMLGHDASFGHIHAVKMVAMKDLLFKRVGYVDRADFRPACMCCVVTRVPLLFFLCSDAACTRAVIWAALSVCTPTINSCCC